MEIYLITSQTPHRNIDGDILGDSFSVEYAFVDEAKAKKKLRDIYQGGAEYYYDLISVPIEDVDSFKFAVMAGMSPAEKE